MEWGKDSMEDVDKVMTIKGGGLAIWVNTWSNKI